MWPSDLRDEAAEGGGLVVLGKAESRGLFGIANGVANGGSGKEVVAVDGLFRGALGRGRSAALACNAAIVRAKLGGRDRGGRGRGAAFVGRANDEGAGGWRTGLGGERWLRIGQAAVQWSVGLIVEVRLEEVAEARDFEAAGDDERAVGLADGGVVGLRLVVLIGDVADDGFDQILDGDETGDATVLVDDDAHMLLFALHLAEEFVDLFGFRNEDGGALELGDGALRGLGVKDLQEVVGEGDAGDVIELAGVDGHAGVDVRFECGGEALERHGAFDGVDLGARGHDFADDLIAELNDGADEFAVGFFEDAFFFAGFKEGRPWLRKGDLLPRCLRVRPGRQ